MVKNVLIFLQINEKNMKLFHNHFKNSKCFGEILNFASCNEETGSK